MQEDANIEQKRIKNMFEKQMRSQHRVFVYFAQTNTPKLSILEPKIMKKVTFDVNLEAKRHRVGG